MPKRDIIVIGASAGGINALIDLLGSLPPQFDSSIFIVQHTSPYSKSQLPVILSRCTSMKVMHAKDGEKIRSGQIYVAPPDHHLILEEGRLVVKKGPKENRFRPSIDTLFRSAAYVYGSRVIGIVLSGLLNDGTSGLWAIKRLGGTTIIQDPADAIFPEMPENALEYVEVDHIEPVSKMSDLLQALTAHEPPATPEITAEEMKLMKTEVVIASRDNAFEMGIMHMGEISPFTCPECHGALISLKEGKAVRYRCHTGHAFSASTLLAGVTTTVEESLWNAMRALEETTMLLEQIGNSFRDTGNAAASKKFFEKAEQTRERARIIHDSVFTQELISEDLRYDKDRGKQ